MTPVLSAAWLELPMPSPALLAAGGLERRADLGRCPLPRELLPPA
jgi:hypothetical protein